MIRKVSKNPINIVEWHGRSRKTKKNKIEACAKKQPGTQSLHTGGAYQAVKAESLLISPRAELNAKNMQAKKPT